MKSEIKFTIHSTDPVTRRVVLATIRAYCKKSGLYGRASAKGIGLDECEESVKELIEYGLLVICIDEDGDTFTIQPPEESDEPFT